MKLDLKNLMRKRNLRLLPKNPEWNLTNPWRMNFLCLCLRRKPWNQLGLQSNSQKGLMPQLGRELLFSLSSPNKLTMNIYKKERNSTFRPLNVLFLWVLRSLTVTQDDDMAALYRYLLFARIRFSAEPALNHAHCCSL